jgi:hypothetical protein
MVSIVIYRLYVQGGCNPDLGVLSDFSRINLEAKDFAWERLKEDVSDYPGKLKCHSAITMYIFGGQVTDNTNSNITYKYNYNKSFWKTIHSSTINLPKLDSHNTVVQEDFMYVLNGYISDNAEYSSTIYKLDLKKSIWTIYYQANA